MATSAGARGKRTERSVVAQSPGIRGVEPMPTELRELLAVRRELSGRISRKRRSIRAAFAEAGVPIAAVLAEAASGTIRAFLEASEGEPANTEMVPSLARALGLPPFAVAGALKHELSEVQRFYLCVQLHRLDALSNALFSAESPRGISRAPRSPRREQ